jgi:hypothetical protein
MRTRHGFRIFAAGTAFMLSASRSAAEEWLLIEFAWPRADKKRPGTKPGLEVRT